MKIELSDKKTIEDIIEIIASKFKGSTMQGFIESCDFVADTVVTITKSDPKICLIASIIILSYLPYNDIITKEYGITKQDILDVLKNIFEQDDKNDIYTRLENLVKNQPKVIC